MLLYFPLLALVGWMVFLFSYYWLYRQRDVVTALVSTIAPMIGLLFVLGFIVGEPNVLPPLVSELLLGVFGLAPVLLAVRLFARLRRANSKGDGLTTSERSGEGDRNAGARRT